MLVLSRKPGECIHIGSNIIVTVLEISGKLVRIGVEAPGSIAIFRAEVKEQIERENILAATKSKYLDRFRELKSVLDTRRKINL